MKLLPGIFAVSLMMAVVSIVPARAQDGATLSSGAITFSGASLSLFGDGTETSGGGTFINIPAPGSVDGGSIVLASSFGASLTVNGLSTGTLAGSSDGMMILTVNNGGTTITGPIILPIAVQPVDVTTGTFTLAPIIVLNGGGLTLTGPTTPGGSLLVNASTNVGTLQFNDGSTTIGATTITLANGAALGVTAASTVAVGNWAVFNPNAFGTITFNSTLALGGTSGVIMNATEQPTGGVLELTPALVSSDPGSVTEGEATPEPSSAALLAFGLTLALQRLRKRRA